MAGGPDSDGASPLAAGIDHGAALRDLDVTGERQFPREIPCVIHQFAPVLATDRARRIRRAGAALPTAMHGEGTDGRAEAHPDRAVTEGDTRVVDAGAGTLDDAVQLDVRLLLTHALSQVDVDVRVERIRPIGR